MKKRILSLALSCVLALTLAVPAFAINDVTISVNNDEFNAPPTACYVIPNVLETKTYPIRRTVDNSVMGDDEDDWVFSQELPDSAEVYVVKAGVSIDLSGLVGWSLNTLALVDGKVQISDEDVEDWDKVYEISFDPIDTEDGLVSAPGSYVTFKKAGFYAFTAYPRFDFPYYSRAVGSCVLYVSDDGSSPEALAATPTVQPIANPATLDGNAITLNSYLFQENGGGTNYVMLRDVAYLLNGSKAQFEVTWSAKDGITLTTGKPYTAVGGEMQGKGDGAKAYAANASTITIDGKAVELTAYTIEGNNYFKLRDLGAALSFGVDWNGASGTVVIDTSKPSSGGQ